MGQVLQQATLQQKMGETDNQYFYRLAQMVPICTDEVHTQINQIVYDRIWKYVKQRIYKKFPTYCIVLQEELLQSAFAQIFQEFPRYPGTCTLPMFCNSHITHACTVEISFYTKVKRYDNENLTKINRAKSQLLANGFSESEITISDIQDLTNLSPVQIENSIRSEGYGKNTDITENSNAVYAETPEEFVVRQEELNTAYAAIKKLTPLEQFVISKKLGLDGTALTYQDIADAIPAYNLTRRDVNGLYNKAIRKMRQNVTAKMHTADMAGEAISFESREDAFDNLSLLEQLFSE